jgi:hypothetical protein
VDETVGHRHRPPYRADEGANRQRIIDRSIIERIDTHHSDKSRYVFPADADMAEKRAGWGEEWWDRNARFHLAMAARSRAS